MEKRSVMKKRTFFAEKCAIIIFILALMAIGYLPATLATNERLAEATLKPPAYIQTECAGG
ncbi:MAG: hypothetical protein FWB96_10285 [Defluviitaleaceae bacterium]|nr:hypothetical protein [Defluviitaleaceae bacterium]MCL2263279.1 hypothetical protein [Defluviitaleaceae bacterium]